MLIRLITVSLSMMLLGVACQKEQPRSKISEVMPHFTERTEGKEELDLLLMLPKGSTKDKVIDNKEAGLLTKIQGAENLYRLQGSKDQLKDLDIDIGAKISLNDQVKIKPVASPQAKLGALDLGENSALDLLTVRNVVGVDEFLGRFPDADGHGVKVAVFDTGIDFGINGLSGIEKGSKLQGFYDLTNFGEVELSPVSDSEEGLPISFAPGLAPKKIIAKGILSEKQLAKNYQASEGVDLNGNGENADEFPFVLGLTDDDQYGVWIDLDGNGVIEDASLEILRDFNTSYQYADMVDRGDQKGSHALAVTIHSEDKVQFHRVLHGHGTACALIIGGDGYGDGSLMGLAPKTSFLSYTLDVTGQDIYTMDQFMEMFLHAKAQGVDAISISWGFSTSDLASARFMADFLDQEIASHGILIAIAAGNNGPGVSSGPSDDYIPHHGFGVGAMVSKAQANNVYGWTGADRDAVVDYSSFGPTRGGRLIPDLISPIISLVRGERGGGASPFYGFSGTSSATPALVGASAALMSVLKHHGPINMRLLKLALQNSSVQLDDTMGIRQGAGLYNISKAYDLYKKLIGELQKAESDLGKQSAFAYELKANIKYGDTDQHKEGIYSFKYEPSRLVNIDMSEASKSLIDPLYFYEPLSLSHESDFFEAPEILNLQASGAKFQIKFNADKLLHRSGVFSDVISLSRPSDGLVLLRIPVVLQLSGAASVGRTLANVDAKMEAFDIWRMPIKLKSPTSINFDGMIAANSGYEGSRVYIYLRSEEGHVSGYHRISLNQSLTPVHYQSSLLPKGQYELLISRNYARPAVLAPIQVFGSFSKPKIKLMASELNKGAQQVQVLLGAYESISWKNAHLRVVGKRHRLQLDRSVQNGQEAFYGSIDLPYASEGLKIGLAQSRLSREFRSMLHMTLALLEPETQDPLFRGWVDVQDLGSVLKSVDLSKEASKLGVMAYPNIVKWDALSEQHVFLELEQKYPDDHKKKAQIEKEYSLAPNEKAVLTFESVLVEEGEIGFVELESLRPKAKISIPIRF